MVIACPSLLHSPRTPRSSLGRGNTPAADGGECRTPADETARVHSGGCGEPPAARVDRLEVVGLSQDQVDRVEGGIAEAGCGVDTVLYRSLPCAQDTVWNPHAPYHPSEFRNGACAHQHQVGAVIVLGSAVRQDGKR